MADYSDDFQVSFDDRAGSCTIRFRCFDTPNAVTVYHARELGQAHVENLLIDVRRDCLRAHMLWSFTRPGSDICAINASRSSVDIDPLTAELVERMMAFCAEEPQFDFTIGPVSYLWKTAKALPTEEQIAQAVEHVGAGKIVLSGTRVKKDDPLVKIDIGGGAKGFMADKIAGRLRDGGVLSADVDLGGNLYMLGDHPSGRPWRVAVKVPEGIDVEPTILDVSDASVVTSGSYERFVEIDGVRYQHIIDAKTGWPVQSDIVSATVVSKSSLEADLLATVACIVGSAGFAALAKRHPSCAFMAFTRDSRILSS